MPRSVLSLAVSAFACFAIARLQLVVTAWDTQDDPWDVATYSRSDSTRYLKIARFGYFEDPTDIRRSDTGWFPGYPLAIRAGSAVSGARPVVVGAVLAAGFQLGLLGLLALIMRGRDESAAFLGLLVAAFFPGAVFYSAVYPISMCASCGLLSVVLFTRGQVLGAGLAGAVAAFSYPTGIVVSATLLLGVLLRHPLPTRQRLRDLLAGPALAALGLPAMMLVQAIEVGDAKAYFRYQSQYGHRPSNPIATLVELCQRVGEDSFDQRLVGLQGLVATTLLVMALAAYARHRKNLDDAHTLLLAQGFLYWLAPLLLGSRLSHFRAEALMVGLVPLLALLPVRALALLPALLSIVSAGLTKLFLTGILH